MLYQLKNNVSQKCGFKIKNRGDCVRLSNMILIDSGIDLSYNTLRRFYGVVKGTKPNSRTLNTLSIYVGYSSYVDFCAAYPQKKNWDIHQKIYNIIVIDPKYALELMNDEFISPESYLELLITLIGGLTVAKNVEILKLVFNSPLLDPKRYNYSEILYLGNCVGPVFKQMETPIQEFISTKYFTPTIFNSFVDISSLNGNYGTYCKNLANKTTNKEQTLFTACIMELRKFLNNQPVRLVTSALNIKQIHPILYGRYKGVEILKKNLKHKEIYTQKFIKKIAKKKNKIDYLYEFLFACILAGEVQLLKFVQESTAHYKISKPYYQEYHYSLFELRDAIVKLKSGANISKKLIKLKNETLFRNSCRDFIELFISILDYHNSGKKRAILDIYLAKARRLNYPIFDEAYCRNYFSK
jgi:hypothetical protein